MDVSIINSKQYIMRINVTSKCKIIRDKIRNEITFVMSLIRRLGDNLIILPTLYECLSLAVVICLSIYNIRAYASDKIVGSTGKELESVYQDCSMCPQLVLLPKGDFFMGGSPDEMSDDLENMTGLARLLNESRELESTPKHLVKITHNILFGKYDITVGEYSNFISETGYNTKGGCWIKNKYKYIFSYSASWDNPGFYQTSKNPVVCISWNDARSYIEWINKKLQTLNNNTVLSLYRLPYENEWEYAARSGKKTTRWWGNDISANKANCQGCGSKWGGQGTSPVGSFEPNQFGLYDMLGNAGQWVEDCWHPNYDNAPGVDSVWSNGSCDKHVMRGGTWLNEAWAVRASIRFKFDTNDRFNCIGFRVVKYVL